LEGRRLGSILGLLLYRSGPGGLDTRQETHEEEEQNTASKLETENTYYRWDDRRALYLPGDEKSL